MNGEKGGPARWLTGAGSGYAAALLGWLALYLYNGYVQLVDAKALFFYSVTLCAVAAVGADMLLRRDRLRVRWHATELWLVGLCLVYTVNLLWARDPALAFRGLAGRQEGTWMLLMCGVCYGLVRISVRQGDVSLLLRVFLASCSCAAALAWLNYFLFDPLSVYYSLQPGEGHMFLSTLGNINFFGGLMCIAAPVALYVFTRSGRWVWGALSVLLCSALLPANSDGAWLGFAAGTAALVCLKGTHTQIVGRLLGGFSAFFVCAFFEGLAVSAVEVRGPLRTISAWLCQPLFALPAAVVCGAVAFFLVRRRVPCERFCRWTVMGIVLALAALTIAVNVGLVHAGALDELLLVGPDWGSGRGYVWSELLRLFAGEFSTLEQIAGVGADGVNALLNPRFTEQMIQWNGRAFDTAHNVYLQHLICGGAIGLLCWCGFWLGRLRCAWRRCSALFPPLVAYCVQAFFSIDTPAVLVPAVVLAALPAVQPGAGETRKHVLLAGLFLCLAGMIATSAIL